MSHPPLSLAEPGTGVLFTNTSLLDDAINLARKNSIHYLLFGLACCGLAGSVAVIIFALTHAR